MQYMYGEFSDDQVKANARLMHGEIHKLLLYKDPELTDLIFKSEEEFYTYFHNLLYRFGGLNSLLGNPKQMVALMSTLQAALEEVQSDHYEWSIFRRLILDAHGYIKSIFEVCSDAEH